MGKIALSLKINVSQIDKARLFAGQKGKYLDCTIFVDLDQLDQYGNSGMITQDVSKDEKQQGVKGNILGNGKVFWVENGQAPQAQGQAAPQQQQAPQQQAPQQQAPQGQFAQQQAQQAVAGGYPQQQQPKVNPQEPSIDFDDDIPF
ncbi:MAG: hypothetical protein JKY81_05760 [Colwellia sp.]|nr:hypothetical protein [Colwellia sp.]